MPIFSKCFPLLKAVLIDVKRCTTTGRMRFARVLVAGCVAAGILLAQSCGGANGPESAAPSLDPRLDPAHASSDPLTPTNGPNATESLVHPVPLLSSPPRSGYAVMPWELLAIRGDRQLVIRYHPAATITSQSTSICTEPLGVLVQTTPSWVLIAPLARTGPPGKVCSLVARYPVVGYIDLATPLGRRQLLHPPVAAGLIQQLQNRPPRPTRTGAKPGIRPSAIPGQN